MNPEDTRPQPAAPSPDGRVAADAGRCATPSSAAGSAVADAPRDDATLPAAPVLRGAELTGCRHRLGRRLRGDAPDPRFDPGPWEAAARRHRATVLGELAQLPGTVTVADGPDADLDTLEALAGGAELVVGAVLRAEGRGDVPAEEARPDLLVRLDGGAAPTYLPVIVAAHKLLRRRGPRDRTPAATVLPVARLGRPGVLGRGLRSAMAVDAGRTLRHHVSDAVRAGQSAALLHALGLGSGLVGGIGADASRMIVLEDGPRIAAYRRALRAGRDVADAVAGRPSPLTPGVHPLAPRRVRECRTCEYAAACDDDLRAADDISLVLPGDRADRLRDAGIGTVAALAGADPSGPGGDAVHLARLLVAGLPAAVRDGAPVPRADVEIDVDVEAYPGHGAYLWGAWDGESYRAFTAWTAPGAPGADDALSRAFARFWGWLTARRTAARDAGLTVRVHCWGAESENHWMRDAARRFGRDRHLDEDGSPVVAPAPAEVDAFLRSAEWADGQRDARRLLLSAEGLGLKTVAPLAGFAWRDPEAGGAGSLPIFRVAAGADGTRAGDAAAARELLLRYNADDCRATAVVRAWLAAGPDLPHVADLPVPR
ncbi:ribonuclease H-like domain-containing protein [Corynebacterium sp. 335C]